MTLPSEVVSDFVHKIEQYAAAVGLTSAIAGAATSIFATTKFSWLTRKGRASIRISGGSKFEERALTSSEAAAIEKALAENLSERFWGEPDGDTLLSLIQARMTRDSVSPSLVARDRVVIRIGEAATSRAEQLSTQKWSKIASNLLTIAQYIIGGVLASSFVQESLSPKWVGALGVLVLIASLFKQQFHPEINAEDSRRKASKLQALVRSSGDQLAILDAKIATGEDHSDAMIALLSQITQRLTEIENPEAGESEPQLVAK